MPTATAADDRVCQWFAGCGRPATGTTPHPILPPVPTCDRCHKFATGKERQR
jgi:hypothetical protein